MSVASPQYAQAQAESRRAEDQKFYRISLSWLGATAGVALGYGSAALVASAARRDCDDKTEDESLEEWGCGMGAALGAAFTGLVTMPALSTLGGALPHHYLGGRGRWWMGLMGSLLGT